MVRGLPDQGREVGGGEGERVVIVDEGAIKSGESGSCTLIRPGVKAV